MGDNLTGASYASSYYFEARMTFVTDQSYLVIPYRPVIYKRDDKSIKAATVEILSENQNSH